jgi:tetratricopeptide (TPR) repeat protein
MLSLTRVAGLAVASLALLCCLSEQSFAGGGDALIEEASSAFSLLDFEGALEKLDRAQKTKGNTSKDLVRIYSLRAKCLISLGREDDAVQAFTAALSIDPAFRLSPDSSPRFAEPFQKLLDRGVAALDVDVSLPDQVVVGAPVLVIVQVAADPAGISDKMRLRYRRGKKKYSALKAKLQLGKRSRFYLPPSIWKAEGLQVIEWHCEILDRHGGLLKRMGDADHPLTIVVKMKPIAAVVAPPPPPPIAKPQVKKPPPPPAWYERWWVWAIVGGVAVAAGTTAGILATSADAPDHRTFTIQVR